MSSSVDISDRTKSRLEALQAEIRTETGREVSQGELLGRIVEHGYDSKEAVIESFRAESGSTTESGTTPLSDEEIEAFFRGSSDWGFETSEEDIDEVLYGK